MTATYYIGDLCYVIEDDVWEEVCDLIFSGGEEQRRRFQLSDGREFFMFGTAHGDGEYSDQFGGSYGVDSGSIGAIRVEDIRDFRSSEERIKKLGCIHTFDFPLTPEDCAYQDGLICFRHLEIDTDPSYPEEEAEDENEPE